MTKLFDGRASRVYYWIVPLKDYSSAHHPCLVCDCVRHVVGVAVKAGSQSLRSGQW